MKKKIFVNKEDSSFQNEHTFDEIMSNLKALGGSVKINGKKTLTLVSFFGCVVISGVYSKDYISKLGNVLYQYSFIEEVRNNNDDDFSRVKENSIIVTNYDTTMEFGYYFSDNNLCDAYSNLVDLQNEERNIIFTGLVIDNETLDNINLRNSLAKEITLDYSSIDNTFIEYLPESLEFLSINHCNFVTNLNGISQKCPNIRGVSVNSLASLSDFSFIYEMPNLEYLQINNNAYVTRELLDYLNAHNIVHNLGEQDIINAHKVDEIISEIIKDDMSDEEKIQAIVLYVINNLEYDMKYVNSSNYDTLNNALNEKKGVCKSYAYLTAILMNKSGVLAYELENSNHAWNLVKLDEEYFYIDPTNIKNICFNELLLENFNVAISYMFDIEGNFGSPVGNITDEDIRIPYSLVVDVLSGREDMNFLEKCNGPFNSIGIILSSVLLGLIMSSCPISMKKSFKLSRELYSDVKKDYLVLKRKK